MSVRAGVRGRPPEEASTPKGGTLVAPVTARHP